MLKFFLFLFSLTFLAAGLFAQSTPATSTATPATVEAQAWVDASGQANLEGLSQLNLAYSVIMVGCATLCLVLNLRSLAYVFLVGYGAFILNVPYHIPSRIQFIVGLAIIFMAVIGLLTRLLLLTKKKPAQGQ